MPSVAWSTRRGIPRRGQARCLPGPRRVPRSPPTGPRGMPGLETLRGDCCWPRNGEIRARSNTATARSISSSSSRVMQPGQTSPRVCGSRSHPLDAAGLGALHRSHEVAGCDGNMVNSGYRGNELPGLIDVGWPQLRCPEPAHQTNLVWVSCRRLRGGRRFVLRPIASPNPSSAPAVIGGAGLSAGGHPRGGNGSWPGAMVSFDRIWPLVPSVTSSPPPVRLSAARATSCASRWVS